VADVGKREPEPAGQAFGPRRGLEQPDGSAGILECPADEGEGRVHVNDFRVFEDRAKTTEVVDRGAQMSPGLVAEVIRVCLVVVSTERTARGGPQAGSGSVRARLPVLYLLQDADCVRQVFAVLVVHNATT
jgi:hypothetical protein